VNGSGASANSDVAPAPVTLTRTIRISRSAPVIRSIALSKTDSGFQVQITGFSTDRDVTEAGRAFNNSALGSLQNHQPDREAGRCRIAVVQEFSLRSIREPVFHLCCHSRYKQRGFHRQRVRSLKNSQGSSNISSASF